MICAIWRARGVGFRLLSISVCGRRALSPWPTLVDMCVCGELCLRDPLCGPWCVCGALCLRNPLCGHWCVCGELCLRDPLCGHWCVCGALCLRDPLCGPWCVCGALCLCNPLCGHWCVCGALCLDQCVCLSGIRHSVRMNQRSVWVGCGHELPLCAVRDLADRLLG